MICLITHGIGNVFVLKETLTKRSTFVKVNESNSDTVHEVMIALHQNNLDVIEAILKERSTPGNELYQHWLTFGEIENYTRNDEAFSAVTNWLGEINATISWISLRKDYLKAVSTIGSWEAALNTKFYLWQDNHRVLKTYHTRSEHYSIPSHLETHITAIFNTCQVPPIIHHYSTKKKTNKSKPLSRESPQDSEVSVPFLDSLYNISSNIGSSSLSQAVFETSSQNFEQSDLTKFQDAYDLTVQAAEVTGTTAATSGCNSNSCGEGSLDIQYIMGVAQKNVGIFWYIPGETGDPFYEFLVAVGSTSDPPTILSISYGSYENEYSTSYLNEFNTEAMKLTSAGITIFVSSGDDGVSGSNCECTTSSSSSTTYWTGSNTWTGTGYFPSYPATCPYVVAVGATQGPESGGPEIACQVSTCHFISLLL